jgi:LysM domain
MEARRATGDPDAPGDAAEREGPVTATQVRESGIEVEPLEAIDPVSDADGPSDGLSETPLAPGRDTQRVLSAICPYLLSEDGSWRAARPLREHRCWAVRPPAVLPLNKQRRLCLIEEHRTCPAFQAAQERRESELAAAGITLGALAARQSRPLARTVPTALDRPSAVPGSASLVANYRRLVQVGLAGLMLLAAALLILARFTGGAPAATPTPTPLQSQAAAVGSSAPSPTVSVEPSAPPSQLASPSEQPSPTPRPSRRFYIVKPGDSLSAIADRFNTTVERLQQLNDIPDPSHIQPGDRIRVR